MLSRLGVAGREALAPARPALAALITARAEVAAIAGPPAATAGLAVHAACVAVGPGTVLGSAAISAVVTGGACASVAAIARPSAPRPAASSSWILPGWLGILWITHASSLVGGEAVAADRAVRTVGFTRYP